jgi:biopolymer transport protein ExbB/TolQ
MENVMMWLALAVVVVVAGISTVLLQKKNGEIKKLSIELAAASQERDEKASAFESLQREFDDKMDRIVQSSIEKIAHAESAKEEAVQAAQDNYEAAAEVHALLKEKEALINKLQKQTIG